MYLDLLDGHTVFLRKYIWKLKVPPKISISMWFLHRKVILRKENLIKRKWQGNTVCCFCDKEETIQHLFFECPLAKVIWRIVHMSFGISPPKNITNMFENWLKGLQRRVKTRLELEFVLSYGQYGISAMTIFLTNQNMLPFCRLYLWLLTGPVRGYVSSRRSNART
jgi:hypothetical protein